MDEDKGESPTTPSVRQTVGHYRILSTLGKGGMGEVYLGEDKRLGRKVAIKLLPARFTTDTGRLRRFAQESRAASALNHPNIIRFTRSARLQRSMGNPNSCAEVNPGFADACGVPRGDRRHSDFQFERRRRSIARLEAVILIRLTV